jgi:hypothetical protein
MKNRPVFTLNPQGEQAGFSAFTPSGRGKKKVEKPCWILICQSRFNNMSIFTVVRRLITPFIIDRKPGVIRSHTK